MTRHANPATPAVPIREAFELARRGQLQRAEALCNEILAEQSEHPEALLLRAVIEVQTGRPAEGAATIRRSIHGDPSRAAAHALLADALSSLNRPQEALESYDAALRLDQGLVSAHYGRGNALLELHRPLEALAGYDQVLASRPDDAEAWCKRGNALFSLKQFDPALRCYDRAVRVRPSYAAALNNRGCALLSMKRAQPALTSFESALAVDPTFADALCNRGRALRELGQLAESLDAYDRTLELRPDYVDALCGRGDVLRELKRPSDALASFERVLQLNPNSAAAYRGCGDALLDLQKPEQSLAAHDVAVRLEPGLTDTHNSRGNSLRALERFPEAIACYEQALRLDSTNVVAHYNRGTALLQADLNLEGTLASYARVLQLNPHFEYVPGALFHARRSMADWSVRVPVADHDHIYRAVLDGNPAAAPFHFLSISDSASAQHRCAKTYVAHRYPGGAARWTGPRHRHERLRVAYVSADFREHAVSYLMAGVFERHDVRRFEIIAISLRPEDTSEFGQRVTKAFDRFVDVSKRSDPEITALLRDLEIDIAVDLSGFTGGFRPQIFLPRAAPIQINYLGFPGTMGAPFMDYILADSFLIPPHRRSDYTERVIYLPDCFQANDDRRIIGARAVERGELSIPRDAFVFCCLNNTDKVNPALFDIWMRLLDRVPGSVLWLLAGHEAVRGNLRREASNRGVDPDRLVFAARVPYPEYLARLKLADLFLDTLPFNGGTTASDALWAGLPLLTCAGEAFASRMAGSLLRAAGAPELITFDLEQYETRALSLARDPHELEDIRRRLNETRRSGPLFDTDRFRRHLEAAYEEMWQRHRRDEEPSNFAVPVVTPSAAR
jgi:protein O-GlcNAc transferase